MAVRLIVEGGPHSGLSRADIGRRARAMLAAVQMPKAELSVVLTNDDQIAKLNRTYRKKSRPTDVLAFAQREGEPGGRRDLLGDVVVSVDTARRQADSRGWDITSEVTMLIAHGLLHLLGWDHATAAEDRRMRRETDRLCDAARQAALGRRRPPPPQGARRVPRAPKKVERAPGKAAKRMPSVPSAKRKTHRELIGKSSPRPPREPGR
jgi:probable rRNA maturation factor